MQGNWDCCAQGGALTGSNSTAISPAAAALLMLTPRAAAAAMCTWGLADRCRPGWTVDAVVRSPASINQHSASHSVTTQPSAPDSRVPTRPSSFGCTWSSSTPPAARCTVNTQSRQALAPAARRPRSSATLCSNSAAPSPPKRKPKLASPCLRALNNTGESDCS